MLVQGFVFPCNISVSVGLAGMTCSSMEEETEEFMRDREREFISLFLISCF